MLFLFIFYMKNKALHDIKIQSFRAIFEVFTHLQTKEILKIIFFAGKESGK